MKEQIEAVDEEVENTEIMDGLPGSWDSFI